MTITLEQARALRDAQLLDDARKIAAYDDLLSTLQEVVDECRVDGRIPTELYLRARAAIAKATGQG